MTKPPISEIIKDMLTSGKCLVIGANGFVGSHLVDELAEAGYAVRAFDRFSGPAQFKKSDQVEVFVGDIFDDQAIHEALDGIDYVFHSFSATTPFASDNDPYGDITLNMLRNVQIFEQCVEAKVKKVMFMSSGGAVYGTLSEHKEANEMDAPIPVSPYGIGKLGTEYYLAYFNRKYGMKSISYRLTNPYGPRQPSHSKQGVIPIFIGKIKAGEDLTVYGDGTSSRDYIYIRDATKMIVESFVKAEHHTYNIGSGRQTNLNEIIESIEEATGLSAKVSHLEAPKTFLQNAQVSINRFTEEFGVVSNTALTDGLKKIISNL
ncbi:MAG: UDP-glucose 4-epimerase [Candidatus Saccharibacteria bacterium]|nr:UDP-glucose 4-epimerase [Candidatus Saccharibacteria bacterium]